MALLGVLTSTLQDQLNHVIAILVHHHLLQIDRGVAHQRFNKLFFFFLVLAQAKSFLDESGALQIHAALENVLVEYVQCQFD